MNAEPGLGVEAWTTWENRIVGGFPLRRLLGCSDRSGVFLTEYKSKGGGDAAIKFVRADALPAQAQLAQWQTAAALDHPHLVRLFDMGRYRSGGRDFVFVVTEHAEQTLASILRHRSLTPAEALELVVPSVDALIFLHRRRLVHGRLQPSNFLAVGDLLKLASDTVRPISQGAKGVVSGSAYDPPELKDTGISTAGDVWGLGVTLLEALTQRTPTWSEQRVAIDLPAAVPAPLADTIRRCLSLAPADRPSVVELRSEYKASPPAISIPDPQPPTPEISSEIAPAQGLSKKHGSAWGIAASILMIFLVWFGFRLASTSEPESPPAEVEPADLPAVVEPSVPVAKRASSVARAEDRTSAATGAGVLHEVRPEVPRKIGNTIKGRIHVTVRVLVGPGGDVIGAMLENPGPSKYFARIADNAARQWVFAPADTQRPRVWLLTFVFTRDGVDVLTTEQ